MDKVSPGNHIFSSPSYYVWGTLVVMQIFDFRFLADLHVYGLENPKNTKLTWCPGVHLLVCMLISLLACRDDIFWTNRRKNFVLVLK